MNARKWLTIAIQTVLIAWTEKGDMTAHARMDIMHYEKIA